MENKMLQEIANWFILIKAPDLKDKISEAIANIDSGSDLSENQRKLIGFICFSFSMNHGPASFIGIEFMVKHIGVEKEFTDYANNWIEHSKKPHPQNNPDETSN